MARSEDEFMIDTIMAKNTEVVQSAKEVLKETKILMSKLSKKERCRNLEFQMMSSIRENESTHNEESFKRKLLEDFKKHRQTKSFVENKKKYTAEVRDVNHNLITLNNNSTSPKNHQEILSYANVERHNAYYESPISPVKDFNKSITDQKYAYPFHIEQHCEEYLDDKNSENAVYSRNRYAHDYPYSSPEFDKHRRRNFKEEHNYLPMYRPVFILPDYCMYDSMKPHSMRSRQRAKSPRESFIEKENAKLIGEDIDGTRVVMKNKKTGYLCNLCGKVYCRKYVLKIHQRVHSGEKPLVCHVCGKCFSDPSNLKKHIKLHEPEQSLHTCHICGRQFARKRSLINHMHTSHESKKNGQYCNVLLQTKQE